MTNAPYVKNYDEKTKILLNPISKANPYLHKFKNTSSQNAELKLLERTQRLHIHDPNPNAKLYLQMKNRGVLPTNKKGYSLTYKEWITQKIDKQIKSN